MTQATFLVVGAHGTVGSDIARTLAAQGARVRGTTSKASQAGTRDGIDYVHLDLATGEGLRAAFEGVDRAFFLAPPGYADQEKLLAPLVAEAARAKLQKVVLMTAYGANAADTPFRRVETALAASGVAYNIIRPNWFMQNFQTFWVHGINAQGKILLPAGSAKVSFIDARDIAAVAVRLLTTDDVNGRDFDLTGSEALDHDAVARLLSVETGRTIAYEEIAPETLRAGMVGAGVPADYADFMLVIVGFLKQGYNAGTTEAVRTLLGREPIRFEQYAHDFRAAWTPTRAAA